MKRDGCKQRSPSCECRGETETQSSWTKQTRHPRYDVSRLQDPSTKNASVLQQRNTLQTLSNIDEQDNEEEDTVNQQWKKVRNSFDKASKTCLGTPKT